MEIVEVATGVRKAITIGAAENQHYKLLTKKRFSFDWKKIREVASIYKLQIEGQATILGAVGLIEWPEEKRTEIKLLASSVENIGKHKLYDGIAGALIAFTCRRAVTKYGQEACVSLVPKSELVSHYMNKYYMMHAGWQLYLERAPLLKLLTEYYGNYETFI